MKGFYASGICSSSQSMSAGSVFSRIAWIIDSSLRIGWTDCLSSEDSYWKSIDAILSKWKYVCEIMRNGVRFCGFHRRNLQIYWSIVSIFHKTSCDEAVLDDGWVYSFPDLPAPFHGLKLINFIYRICWCGCAWVKPKVDFLDLQASEYREMLWSI